MLRPNLCLSGLFVLLAFSLFGQVPQGISYQAALRQPNGQVLAQTAVSVRFSVLSGSATGPVAWQETHAATTSAFGMFTLIIGQGQNTGLGSAPAFSAIPWATGMYFLKVEAAQQTGNYELIGTSQMLSVPYALHAATADNINDADADPTNELIDSVTTEGQTLHITEAGITHTVDLSFLQNDADADPANEVITSLLLNESFVLKIEEAGTSHNLDLSALVNDADADPTNELIQAVFLQNGNTLSITEAGTTHTVDLSALTDDADADPTNELIQAVFLQNGNTLSITEAGTTHTVDLSTLTDDADADPTNESLTLMELQGTELHLVESGQSFSVDLAPLTVNQHWIQTGNDIYNDSEKVGINTQQPTSDLHVNGSLSVAFRKLDSSQAQTALPTDNVLLCDVTAGFVVVNLPSAAACSGRVYTVRKLSNNPPPITNSVVINAAFGEQIENMGFVSLDNFFPEVITILSDGTKWWVLSKTTIQ